jgi:hypothetical protein
MLWMVINTMAVSFVLIRLLGMVGMLMNTMVVP